MKKVLVQFEFPGVTLAQYDKVWDAIRAAGHENPQGLIHHTGARSGNALVVADVWESEEAFTKFGSVLMPILKKNGFPAIAPRVLPAHFTHDVKSRREAAVH